jgi:hypothetical protein
MFSMIECFDQETWTDLCCKSILLFLKDDQVILIKLFFNKINTEMKKNCFKVFGVFDVYRINWFVK